MLRLFGLVALGYYLFTLYVILRQERAQGEGWLSAAKVAVLWPYLIHASEDTLSDG